MVCDYDGDEVNSGVDVLDMLCVLVGLLLFHYFVLDGSFDNLYCVLPCVWVIDYQVGQVGYAHIYSDKKRRQY